MAFSSHGSAGKVRTTGRLGIVGWLPWKSGSKVATRPSRGRAIGRGTLVGAGLERVGDFRGPTCHLSMTDHSHVKLPAQ